MTSERRVLAETLIGLTALPDSLFWRHNTGQAWQGRRAEGKVGSTVRIEPGMVILRDARPVKFGLEGSGDIIGTIKPPGGRGQPIAVETKAESGKQRDAQLIFERQWVKAGGIYVLARTAEEAVNKVQTSVIIG
jgi:hypothetical protein